MRIKHQAWFTQKVNNLMKIAQKERKEQNERSAHHWSDFKQNISQRLQ
jgi:hypothetical protein